MLKPSPTGLGFPSKKFRLGTMMKGKDGKFWEVTRLNKKEKKGKRWSRVNKMKGGGNMNNNSCFVAFVVDWCGYCKMLKPNWEHFSNNYSDKKILIVTIDCDEHPEIAKYHKVKSYPTIKYLPNGLSNSTDSIDYKGERTFNEFSRFLSKVDS